MYYLSELKECKNDVVILNTERYIAYNHNRFLDSKPLNCVEFESSIVIKVTSTVSQLTNA